MPTPFAIGAKIKFQDKDGTVTGFRGNKVMVLFSFISHDIPIDPESLVLVSKKEVFTEKITEINQPKQSIDTKRADILISLEALRFGLVPWGHVKDLTIGYEEIEKWASRYFPTKQSDSLTVSEIRGDFGGGKSHSLNVIRNIAKETGYLTSWIEVDGNQVTFSSPTTVLQQIWGNLEGINLTSTTKLLDLHLKAIEIHGEKVVTNKLSPSHKIMYANEAIKKCMRSNILDDFGHRIDCVLSSVPEETTLNLQRDIKNALLYSSFIKIKPMVSTKVSDRPSDFLHTLIGNACLAQLAGYKGLIITVDEFEVEDFVNNSNQDRTRSLLEALEEYAQGNTDLPKAPISIFIATVDKDEGLSVDKSLNVDKSLSISRIVNSSNGETKILTQLGQEDLHSLARKIYQFYMSGYSISSTFKEEIIGEVEDAFDEFHAQTSGYTRSFIKQLMYVLDSQYGTKGA